MARPVPLDLLERTAPQAPSDKPAPLARRGLTALPEKTAPFALLLQHRAGQFPSRHRVPGNVDGNFANAELEISEILVEPRSVELLSEEVQYRPIDPS